MKKISTLLVIFLLIGCNLKEQKVERIYENGIEIIINQTNPYKVKGKLSDFTLKKEFSIDTEKDEIAKTGLVDIENFDIDSEGNIYLLTGKGEKNLIYKFDKNGNFLFSFCKKGEGPGELIYPLSTSFFIDFKDRIIIRDVMTNKFCFFNKNGKLIGEIKCSPNLTFIFPLPKDKFLILKRIWNYNADYHIQDYYSLGDKGLKEIIKLNERKIPNPLKGKTIKGIYYTYPCAISDKYIFIGNQEIGYEISVYDFNGNLIRKIRKNYKKVPIPDGYKKNFEGFPDFIKKKIQFPKYMPPFHSFFTDNDGRLFVMTYDMGGKSNKYFYDIFNSKGIFICRKSLNIFFDRSYIYAKVKNQHLYCIQEKESGFKQLIVYKIKWAI
ncbi:6-bladed beta-propeller [Candidatus Aminicenantes bacterium AC-335-K20]|jgi:hypothetical protein|nr:6-bladed beta-propeller [SCandidatus Aminicenantes bacterium Aminicenantia_JdfR_composite]MCP2596740.1 6-bladed beta-propeller [Candidatus Aminicenantes bacterium AC-335-G13]MCP2619266.1 6-bladed beta-propeller [Candidatus Aminicenantes bacterium AC-335-K20]MCP2620432.1 6-bladed beta-propeller [Candidatus Aminicenantes bacterium AC-334-E05]